MAAFKECFCNKNLVVLIIEGNPSQDEIINAWNEIVFEYGALIKTETSEYLYDLQHRIAELNHHINYVDNALILLYKRYNQYVVNELIKMGYAGVYNFDDHTEYVKQLGRIKSLCKTRIMDLLDLQDEYSKYNNSQPGGSQTEEAFEEWISDLGRYQHYPINQQDTTVLQLVGIINSYIKYHKSKKPKNGEGSD